MFNEYDVVVANKGLSENVAKGCIGAILIYFGNGDYEVEFVNSNKETIEVLTVSENDLDAAVF